jgi:hypothetical protein
MHRTVPLIFIVVSFQFLSAIQIEAFEEVVVIGTDSN